MLFTNDASKQVRMNISFFKTVCAIGGVILLIALAGCWKNCMSDSDNDCKLIYFNDGMYDDGPEGDDTRVISYKIKGDCLYLTVGYGGGCKEHDIQLAVTGWIYTHPPQVNAKIVHDDQDDCEAYIQEEVGFDLGSLDSGSDFIINIKGFDEQIFIKGSQ